MKKNNLLADRLNAYKNGKEIPKVEKEVENYNKNLNQNLPEKTNSQLLKEIGYEIFNLSFVVLNTLAYGYSLKLIFNTDWNSIGVLAIGYSLYTIIHNFLNIFKTNKNEKI